MAYIFYYIVENYPTQQYSTWAFSCSSQ